MTFLTLDLFQQWVICVVLLSLVLYGLHCGIRTSAKLEKLNKTTESIVKKQDYIAEKLIESKHR